MNAIDFKELLRKERKAVRASKSGHLTNNTKSKEPLWQDSSKSILLPEAQSLVIPESCREFSKLKPADHILQLSSSSDESIDRIFYIPKYINEDLHALLLNQAEEAIAEYSSTNGVQNAWVILKSAKRRVALFRSDLSSFGSSTSRENNDTMYPTPDWIESIAEGLVSSGVFESKPNHVLVNAYNPGEGIMPHTDGPEYYSKTATLSIGGPAILKFKHRLRSNEIGVKSNSNICEVLMEGGSLVVFDDSAYNDHLHSIDEVITEVTSNKCINAQKGKTITRSFRMSFTFRLAKNEIVYKGNE